VIRFSVVIPVWNGVDTIDRTLRSVFSQLHRPDEVVIVDDGSTDSTLEVLQAYASRSEVTIKTIDNSGPSVARNTGALLARNEYLAFLDSDDVWSREHLKNLSEIIERYPSSSLYVSGYVAVTEESDSLPVFDFKKPSSSQIEKTFDLKSYLIARLRGRRIAWTSAVSVRKSDFFNVGGFDPNFMHGEDQGLWLKLASHGGVAKSQYVTAKYVKGPSGISSKFVSETDGCMHAAAELIAGCRFSRWTNLLLHEFHNKYALIHARDAIRRGEYDAGKRFILLASPTLFFFHRRIILVVLMIFLPYLRLIFSRFNQNVVFKSKEN